MRTSIWENDNFIKVFAALLALVLWMYVGFQNPETETTIKDVDISVQMPQKSPENGTLDIIGDGSYKVDITVSGKRNVLRGANASSVSAFVDATKITAPGTYELPIETTVNTGDMLIIRKSMSTIKLRFDNIISAKVPVSVSVENKLGKTDYTYDTPTFTPQYINVVGPATEVSSIVDASVVCKLDKLADVLNQSYGYTFINSSGKTVDSSKLSTDYSEVAVSVAILEKKSVPLKINLLNNVEAWNGNLLTYTLNPAAVTIVGSSAVISAIDSIVAGTLDVSTLTSGGNYPFDIPLPANVKSADGITSVTVNVHLGAMDRKTFTIQKVNLINVPDGETAAVDATIPVQVTLRGPADALAAVKPEDITATVNAALLPAASGTYSANASVTVGNSTSVGVLGDVSVTVQVKTAT